MHDATRYQRNIAHGLSRAFRQSGRDELTLDHQEIRYIIFSDHHRGGKARTDDFRLCERAYMAALGYYLEKDYTLLALGDVEELWASTLESVIHDYPATVALEREFHQAGRYLRFFGNHDDLWSDAHYVTRHLEPLYRSPLSVMEGMRIAVRGNGREMGTLFFAHGRTGEFWSDRHGRLGRWGAHKFLLPYKRLRRTPAVTPATDNQLRKRHNIAMHKWATRQPCTALIAGHTHKPVFLTEANTDLLQFRLEEKRTDPHASREEIALDRAELEWILAQQRLRCSEVEEELRPLTPCYFNTGCCSFRDGDVTGIEISDGMIRLVHWPDEHKRPLPKILASTTLEEVFQQLAEAGDRSAPCAQ
jgi:hypothetical protein